RTRLDDVRAAAGSVAGAARRARRGTGGVDGDALGARRARSPRARRAAALGSPLRPRPSAARQRTDGALLSAPLAAAARAAPDLAVGSAIPAAEVLRRLRRVPPAQAARGSE